MMDRRTKLLGRFKIVNNLRSPSLSKVVNGMKVFYLTETEVESQSKIAIDRDSNKEVGLSP